MRVARFGLTSFLALVLVLSFASAIRVKVAAEVKTIFVPTDFSTIQEAINNAAQGDTVFVYNGTYTENVIVNKTISLVGENNTTTFIDGGKLGVAVKVTGDNVSITGFTIANGSLAEGGAAILLYNVGSSSIGGNVMISSYAGASLVNSSFCSVQNNYVSGCNISLLMNFSNGNTLQGNILVSATRGAVQMDRSSNNALGGNDISNGGAYGVHLSYSPQNQVYSNEITGCNDGLLLEYSASSTLSANNIYSNRYNFGVSGDGLADYVQSIDVSNKVDGKSIYYLVSVRDISMNASLSQNVGYLALVNSSNVKAKGLRLSGNGEGFLSAYSTDCLLENCSVSNSRRAGFIYYSARCSLVNDSFTANTGGVSVVSSPASLVKKSSFVDIDEYGLTLESSGGSVVEENSIRRSVRGGLNLYASPDCNVSKNTIVGNGYGIFAQISTGVNVNNNVVTNNTGNGIYFSYSDNGSAQGNSIIGNDGYGVVLQAVQSSSVANNLLKNNTQSGVYMVACLSGQVSSNVIEHNQAGITLQSSLNTRATGNQIVANVHEGMLLIDSSNSDVSANALLDNGWEGLSFQNSGKSTMNTNVVFHNARYGIWLQDSPQVTILNSNVSSNADDGIYLRGSDNSRILNSVMKGNGNAGCRLYLTNLVTLAQNNMTNNKEGVRVFLANNSTISDNRLLNNTEYGINLYSSVGNKLYHNNFINNAVQNAKVLNATSVWDDGYPSGGNYWSNYVSLDLYWGSKQDQPGADGIGDTSYVIDSENKDRYPLMTAARFHDLTLEKLVLPSNEVYVGWAFSANITVKNVGGYVENSSVSVYYGGSVIQTRQLTNLMVGSSSTVSLIWNTSSLPQCRTYDVKAEVSIVAGETHVEDNVYDFGLVKVKMVGDVNSDAKVNILDIFAIATAFNSRVGEPRYKMNYDMNLDFVINILDLAMAALNFNKICSYSG